MSTKQVLLLAATTLPASFPLLRDGFFSSSDGMIHLYRVFELDRAVRAGIFFPRWFPLSGYGYGLPVLNYYPPLMYYLAEFFHLLGAGYISSVKLVIAFGFVLAAFSMFLFARDLLGAAPGLVAAIAFAYLPYLLSDAYIRGNFPEMLAMGLIPLALFAFRRVFATHDPKSIILAAISFALIILTHHLTAMLAALLIGAYVFFLFALDRNWKKLAASAGAVSLSLALASFYWVPALTELNLIFVGPASLARFLVSRLVSIEQFFAPSLAYTYIPQSDALRHTAGFPQTVAAFLAIVVVFMTLRAKRRTNLQPPISSPQFPASHVIFFLIVLIISVFMMLNLSEPLWYAIPALRFMQFPWRFEVLAGISIAFLIGVIANQFVITNNYLRIISYALASVSLISLALFNLPDRSFALTDAQVNLLRSNDPDYVVEQMGWSWTREFVPAAVREENVVGAITRRVVPETPRAIPSLQIEKDSLLSRALRVSNSEAFEISLHQFFFLGWQAYIDGNRARTYPGGSLGLVTVTAPPGDHALTFQFEETRYRMVMDLISVAAFLGIVAWLFSKQRYAFIALFLALTFLGVLIGFQTRAVSAVQPIALSADLGHNATLIGYSTEREGDAFYVTLEWFALREMDRDYIAFVHLVDASGAVIGQSDALTDWGVTPTTRWQRGEIVTDRRVLSLKDVPRAAYRLFAGMYSPRNGGIENLVVYDRDGKQIGNQVELGSVQIGQ